MLAVLCHESAHLARRDHRVVILQELLASALWFHPLVPLFNRMLNRVREEVCDNYAIAVVDRASYCEALLLLAVGRPGASPRGATSMWTRRWSLEDRVRGILDEQRPTRTRISRVRPLGDRDVLGGDLRPRCHAATDRVTAQRSERDDGRGRRLRHARKPAPLQTK